LFEKAFDFLFALQVDDSLSLVEKGLAQEGDKPELEQSFGKFSLRDMHHDGLQLRLGRGTLLSNAKMSTKNERKNKVAHINLLFELGKCWWSAQLRLVLAVGGPKSS
jgi:hypothetical protein